MAPARSKRHVFRFGASGRIGRRITTELLERGHTVTGVSRSGEIDGTDPLTSGPLSGMRPARVRS